MQPSAGRAPVAPTPVAGTLPEVTDSRAKERDLQLRTDTALSPPGFTCGTGRRINGDDRIAAMLRQELLPLLYRMCAFDGMAP